MRRLFSCLCVCVSAFFAGCGHDAGHDHSDGDNVGIDVRPTPSSCVIDSDCDGMGICEAKQCLATCSTKGDKLCGRGTACDGNLCRPVVDCPTIRLPDGVSYSGKKCIKVHSHTPSLQWANVFNGDLTFDEAFVKESKSKFDSRTGNDFTSPNYVLQINRDTFNKGFAWGITVYAGIQFLNGALNYMNAVMQCFMPEGKGVNVNSDNYKIGTMSVNELTGLCVGKFGKGISGNNVGTIRQALRNDINATFCNNEDSRCEFDKYKNQMVGSQCIKAKSMLQAGSNVAKALGAIFGTSTESSGVPESIVKFIEGFATFDKPDGCKAGKCSTATGLADMIADEFELQCGKVVNGIFGSSMTGMLSSIKTIQQVGPNHPSSSDVADLAFCQQSDALMGCLVNTTKMSLSTLNEKIAGSTSLASLLEFVDPEYFWLTGGRYIPISILTKNDVLSQNDLIMAIEYQTQDAIFSGGITGALEIEGCPDYAMASAEQALVGQKYSSLFSYKEKGGRTTGAFVYRRNFAGSPPSKAICPNNVCSLNVYARASQTDNGKGGMRCGGVTFIIKNLSGYVVLKDGDYVE